MKKRLHGQLCWMAGILLISAACSGIKTTPTTSPTKPPVATEAASPTEVPSPTVTASPTETPSPTITLSPTIVVPPTEAPVVISGSILTRLTDGMVMVIIPEGDFPMGSEDSAINERPQHTVSLDAYWIDKTEVTNVMFAHFVEATGYQTDGENHGSAWVLDGEVWSEVEGADWKHPQGPGNSLTGLDNHPVVNVSWNDAVAYCEWAGARLPSEAEWEKAALGTDGRTYPWGEQSPAGDLLNYADVNLNLDWADMSVDDGYRFTAPVGSYPAGASPYGVLDMAGNVWEWVNDWYTETYYRVSPASNPAGPTYGDGRVLRGGSWNHDGHDIRSTMRMWANPSDAIDNFGFRCALTLP